MDAGPTQSVTTTNRKRVAIVANYPSHYCVDLFNQLARQPELAIKVFYLRRQTPGRQWSETRTIVHDHEFVPEWRIHRTFYLNPGLLSRVLRYRPSQLVITQYASIGMQVLMVAFTLLRRSWIFWSEAPGVQYSEMPAVRAEFLRRILRPIALLPIRRWPSLIWGVGTSTTEHYRHLSRSPCENVPYYFDQATFQELDRTTREPGPLRLLFSGKLVHRKGFDILLDALRQVIQHRIDFDLTVLGSGPDEALVADQPEALRARITMLGFREVREIPSVYAACDVLVFPTRYDGWGLAVIEAMAAGMPVIASRASVAAVDAIDDGTTGILVDAESAPSLAQAILRILDSQDQIRTMGDAARITAKRYDANEGARRIVSLLTESNHRRDP